MLSKFQLTALKITSNRQIVKPCPNQSTRKKAVHLKD